MMVEDGWPCLYPREYSHATMLHSNYRSIAVVERLAGRCPGNPYDMQALKARRRVEQASMVDDEWDWRGRADGGLQKAMRQKAMIPGCPLASGRWHEP